MKKLAVTLAVAMAIAISLTGCGSDTKSPLITYVARGSSDSRAPHLFTLDEKTQKSTAVAIPIPTSAEDVAANSDATAVTYYRSDDNGYDIFLMGTDGKEKQLTTDGYSWGPAFSPDGKTIAYVNYAASDADQIFTMNADGSNQKALYPTTAGTAYAYLPQFSPDGKSLVFFVEVATPSVASTHRPGSGRPSSGPQMRNGRSRAAVPNSGQSNVALAANGWYTMALTGTTPTLVYSPTEWWGWGPAVYSADGKKLLMTMYDGNKENISSVNLDGTGLTPLTTGTDADSFSPVPYKNLILFNRDNETNSSWDIYVMDQAGANQTLVSSTANACESLIDTYWSRD